MSVDIKLQCKELYIDKKKLSIPNIEFTKIGPKGGNAIICFGKDTVLTRYVAVKVWIPKKGDIRPKKEQALYESQKLAQLNDSRIVQVYFVDETNGYFYAVEEYIEGKTLKEWMKENHDFFVRQAIWNDIVDAMDVAHKIKIYHGDLHTKNIMLTKDNAVKIIDFGTSVFARTRESSIKRECELIKRTALELFSEYKMYECFLDFVEIRPEIVLHGMKQWVELISIITRIKSSLDDYTLKSCAISLVASIVEVPVFNIPRIIDTLHAIKLKKTYIEFFLGDLLASIDMELNKSEEGTVNSITVDDGDKIQHLFDRYGLLKCEYRNNII